MRPAVGLLLFYKEKSEENVKHQDKGYTANLGFRLHRSDGSAVEKLHTAWTHKGRKFLYHELKRRGLLPMAEQESLTYELYE